MTNMKYMMSGGLAFSEQKDMQKLQKNAQKGWHLSSFATLGYNLEKKEPEDVQYSIDYRKLEKVEEEEYFELFSTAGWTHVCSSYEMHIFKASPNIKPIYTDVESNIDKIERLARPVNISTIFVALIAMLFWVIMTFTNSPFQQIGTWLFICSYVLLMPMLGMLVVLQYRKWIKKC
ncbi:DUF2812 domain-containing protein [Viridibacillus sp. FSL E2-0187]|uniref:DUF2812 domain-containing protein n=1 Tax=Viridibacillus sp. FSL E2-0187 TaxID=2921362 RepID=UPI0030F63D33